jgi:hypothetical protein
MGLPSYMRSVVGRNVVMRRIPVYWRRDVFVVNFYAFISAYTDCAGDVLCCVVLCCVGLCICCCLKMHITLCTAVLALHVGLCQDEIWFVILRYNIGTLCVGTGCRLQCFDRKRRKLRENCVMRRSLICSLYRLLCGCDRVKDNAMIRGCMAWEGAGRNVDGIWMGGRGVRRRLWIIGLGLRDFSTVDVKEIRYGVMDWIKLAVNRVERVMLWRTVIVQIISTIWATVSFSRSSLFHEVN